MLGFGDVRLAAVLGMLLGWYGLPFVLYGALVGHLFALAIAVVTCSAHVVCTCATRSGRR